MSFWLLGLHLVYSKTSIDFSSAIACNQLHDREGYHIILDILIAGLNSRYMPSYALFTGSTGSVFKSRHNLSCYSIVVKLYRVPNKLPFKIKILRLNIENLYFLLQDDALPSLCVFKIHIRTHTYQYMGHVQRIWYLSPMRAAKVQASLRIRAVSPEPPLLAHTSSESRGTFKQKAKSLAL